VRGVSLLLGACGVVAAGLLWHSLALQIPVPSDGASTGGRLSLALAWLLPSVAILWAMVVVQMAGRFILGRFDPLAGAEARFLAVNQRVITNTVEQAMVFVPALLALAAGAPGALMPQVLALPAVFVVARCAFWAGYLVAPIGRSLGMAATLAVTTGTLGGAIWIWIGR
jgi:hypothetical protein